MSQHTTMQAHNRTVQLPAGGASATSAAIDGQERPFCLIVPDILAFVDAPSLTAVQLPSGQTITYALVESNNADLSSPISTTTIGVQTGTGSTIAASQFAGRLKYAGGRYFGLKVTASSTAAATAASVTLQIASLRGAL